MSKISYVVTSGEYSAYSIEGVFSTREKADAFAKECGGQVEEYVIDDRVEEIEQKVYVVRLDADGNLIQRVTVNKLGKPGQFKASSSASGRCEFMGASSDGYERAQKLAAEERQAFLRQHGAKPDLYRYVIEADLVTGKESRRHKCWVLQGEYDPLKRGQVSNIGRLLHAVSTIGFEDCLRKIEEFRSPIMAALKA